LRNESRNESQEERSRQKSRQQSRTEKRVKSLHGEEEDAVEEQEEALGQRDHCRRGSRDACRCILACDPIFGDDVDRCEGPVGHEEDQRRREMLNRLIGETLRSTEDVCSAMTCVVQCARQLHCYDRKVEEDCEKMLQRTGEQHCGLRCSSESDEPSSSGASTPGAATPAPLSEALSNPSGSIAASSGSADGKGTLDLLRDQLKVAGSYSPTVTSSPNASVQEHLAFTSFKK
jgi:hypothetical protein